MSPVLMGQKCISLTQEKFPAMESHEKRLYSQAIVIFSENLLTRVIVAVNVVDYVLVLFL